MARQRTADCETGAMSNAGFGSDVRLALARRRQWLVANALGKFSEAEHFEPSRNLLNQLRERDIRRTSAMMSAQLGLTLVNVAEGENVTGTFARSAHLASGKYAIVQNAKEFTLVPWQPQMERFRGREVWGAVETSGHQLGLGSLATARFGDFLSAHQLRLAFRLSYQCSRHH